MQIHVYSHFFPLKEKNNSRPTRFSLNSGLNKNALGLILCFPYHAKRRKKNNSDLNKNKNTLLDLLQ
jgi:hypothetical protein